ncbi:DUF4382 domain-containing protein [Flagellimonas nanhaiensis]|uniref:DUF4382 domain-containing protein n=1 Tax=Flagellimonas nanhaiensis TaxID=2292706 RepID=A0A371JTL2_9FLAO|nr:DUF4382 domain-containing protein [Allomuricauda nanhaiensis]RDY61173.1 DUF4382 domain-containing protein [Allomuricauda nanhaiensis]
MKTKLITVVLSLFTLLFLSCSEDSANEKTETGRLSVQLTDAPFPFDLVAEANVTIFKVEARTVENDDDEDSDENNSSDDMEDNSSSPYVTLMEEEVDVNLLDLINGNTMDLADAEVPVGTYDLIRVYVKGVNVVLTDGRSFDLKVPSGEQTGIKVFIDPPLTVAGGLSSDLLLDFDVSRSFVPKGNINSVNGINGFNFKPVIKASNLSTAGTLQGNVSTTQEEVQVALENAQVSIMDNEENPVTSGVTDSEGNYTVMGLEAGTYKVFASLNGYVNSDTLDVEIITANKTVQDFTLELEE